MEKLSKYGRELSELTFITQRGGWKKEGWAEGKGSDEKTHREMRGARDQGVCLGVDSMETNRPQWSAHRKQTVFPRKEHPGMLNTEKHTDKYTHTLRGSHCFRMRSINPWLNPDPGCWCEHVWYRLDLPLDTLPVRPTHHFHLLIRGCNNVYTL